MKTKLTWKPGKRNADRSAGTAREVSPHTQLLSQVSRVHSTMV